MKDGMQWNREHLGWWVEDRGRQAEDEREPNRQITNLFPRDEEYNWEEIVPKEPDNTYELDGILSTEELIIAAKTLFFPKPDFLGIWVC